MPSRNRILAVDDNPTNLAIIEEALQGRFNLRLARDGTEALGLAPTFLPDVVLLDAMMPKPDGFEVCSLMKNDSVLRHTRIIMVSAKTALDDRIRGYQAGADDYVTKPFSEEELCAKVAVGMRTKTIYATVQDEMDALCGTTAEVLELVSHLRDAETGSHLDRIRAYSHLLAAELRQQPFSREIDDLFLDDLDRASALHDLGKIAIPDAILRKPGPLTGDERSQMQQHTIIGEQILNRLSQKQPGVSFFRMAAEVARWHHEGYDGGGYPDGLCGEAIPLAARIVKVADVFDALTSVRVYKPAYDPLIAVEEMLVGKGHAYDPVVVDALLRVYDEFVELCRSSASAEALESPAATALTI
jgi:cyclic di-GMP phosphodiesterase